MQRFTTAVATEPNDGTLWLKLSRALLAVQGINSQETASLQSDASSAAYNAYLLLRTAPTRAGGACRHRREPRPPRPLSAVAAGL